MLLPSFIQMYMILSNRPCLDKEQERIISDGKGKAKRCCLPWKENMTQTSFFFQIPADGQHSDIFKEFRRKYTIEG